MFDTAELALGALLVLIYAHERFNQPFSNRSSTTALRYFTALVAYYGVALLLYTVLTRYPQLLELLTAGASEEVKKVTDEVKGVSPPLVIALLMTVLLSKIPGLSSVDNWMREKLQRLAAIPYEVMRLSAELRKSGFEITDDQRAALKPWMQRLGVAERDIVFEESDNAKFDFAKVSSLLLNLESWETRRGFSGFMASFDADYKALKERHKSLARSAARCFDLMSELSESDDERVMRATNHYVDSCREQANRLLKSICDFVSRGVLQSMFTEESRNRELAALGYRKESRPALPINAVMAIFLLLFFILLISFSVIGLEKRSFAAQLLAVILVATNYAVAVWFAVFPKTRWSWANRDRNNRRPAAFYITAAVLAVAAGVAIGFGLRLLSLGSVDAALDDLGRTYPWYFTTFVMALVTAFQLDDEVSGSGPQARQRLRLREAAFQAVAAGISGIFALIYYDPGPDGPARTPLFIAAPLILLVIGFVIGFFVPTWYRDARGVEESELEEAPIPPMALQHF